MPAWVTHLSHRVHRLWESDTHSMSTVISPMSGWSHSACVGLFHKLTLYVCVRNFTKKEEDTFENLRKLLLKKNLSVLQPKTLLLWSLCWILFWLETGNIKTHASSYSGGCCQHTFILCQVAHKIEEIWWAVRNGRPPPPSHPPLTPNVQYQQSAYCNKKDSWVDFQTSLVINHP